MSKTEKYVYSFGPSGSDGDASMRALLGGKGANLAEMTNLGLPVPAGFTIGTNVCTYYYAHEKSYPPELRKAVDEAITKVEAAMGAKFGSNENPLLLSCRSGARDSMPGMMDTVLNIGLNDKTVAALAKASGNERFAWDSYRRFVQMYGDVVLDMKPKTKHDHDPFEELLDAKKHEAGVTHDYELTPARLKELVGEFKTAIKKQTGKDFPDNPMDQVWGAISAVFGSWMNDRAVVYRQQYGIPHEWGTAVNVQAMVFGNLGDDCATGVAMTRDVALGEPGLNGDYLINAQGEDVVAGIRTPKRIEETLEKEMPVSHKELVEIGKKLEKHYRDVQDVEFTVQRGKVWMLQTRNAKRTGFAAVRIAVDMVNEGLIEKDDALDQQAHSGRRPESIAPPAVRPRRQERSDQGRPLPGQGHQRRPWRRQRTHLLPRFRRRGTLAQGQQSAADACPPRDQPGRPARHEDRRRHPHRVWRRELACGPRQPADGQGVHRRLRLAQHRLPRRHDDRQRQDAQGRRLDLDRRLDRRSLRGPGQNRAQRNLSGAHLENDEARGVGNLSPLRATNGLGRRGPQAARAHQCRRAEASDRGDRVRRRRHRPLPHRAHVLRAHRRLPRDDSRHDARGPRKGARQAPAAPAEGFRWPVPRHARPAGDDPLARSAVARVPAACRGRAKGARRQDRRDAGIDHPPRA